MQDPPARASCSKAAFSGDISVAPWRSDAILEALRPWAGGPASMDGAVATMATIVATSGPLLQVHGTCAAAQVVGGVVSSLAAKREADSSSWLVVVSAAGGAVGRASVAAGCVAVCTALSRRIDTRV